MQPIGSRRLNRAKCSYRPTLDCPRLTTRSHAMRLFPPTCTQNVVCTSSDIVAVCLVWILVTITTMPPLVHNLLFQYVLCIPDCFILICKLWVKFLILHWQMHQNLILFFIKKNFYILSYDLWFFKKNLIKKISKTWCSGKKLRPDSNSAQKTILKMTYLIPSAHRSLLLTTIMWPE